MCVCVCARARVSGGCSYHNESCELDENYSFQHPRPLHDRVAAEALAATVWARRVQASAARVAGLFFVLLLGPLICTYTIPI